MHAGKSSGVAPGLFFRFVFRGGDFQVALTGPAELG
jgi:hypothetical protein